jgi:hypothetical protein
VPNSYLNLLKEKLLTPKVLLGLIFTTLISLVLARGIYNFINLVETGKFLNIYLVVSACSLGLPFIALIADLHPLGDLSIKELLQVSIPHKTPMGGPSYVNALQESRTSSTTFAMEANDNTPTGNAGSGNTPLNPGARNASVNPAASNATLNT